MLSINEFMDQDLNAKKGDENDQKQSEDIKFRVKAGIFLGTVMGMSMLFGFGTTLAMVKKKDPVFFNKGILAKSRLAESGSSLALRALGWGTVYSVTGCGLLFYGIWKLLGVKDLQEFRLKMGSWLPRIPKPDSSQGETEFDSIRDFVQYLINGDEKNKMLKSEESHENGMNND